MSSPRRRPGVANRLYVLLLASAALLAVLLLLIYRGARDHPADAGRHLTVFCAAGLRYAMDEIVADYQREYGVSVQLQYAGSNTLLSQLAVIQMGDLYLAADEGYIRLAREKDLIAEQIPLARQRPVILVGHENPKHVQGVSDLLRGDVTTCLGNPDGAAIGQKTRQLLTAAGLWARIEKRVVESGVFKPTVNDVANDVKLGSVDAGIVWDSTAAQYPELQMIRSPELDAGAALVEIAVLQSTRQPTAALRLARYVGARDRGLQRFREKGFEPVDGDRWAQTPELTFFAGAVNRAALAPVIKEFEQREGVRVNTIFNGCGILTAQMRAIRQKQGGGFPDAYMACDVYYLDTVKEMFQEAVNVSDTDIVIAVQKGNPKNIQGLADLLRPDVQVVIGQPDQCTIGVLSRRLLVSAGVYDRLVAQKNVPQKPSSAMLVPDVAIGAADAALAYRTDTQAEAGRVDIISIDSPLAKAIQPFSIARTSDYKYLSRRLYQTIAKSRDKFEAAGFHWRLDDSGPRERVAKPPAESPAPAAGREADEEADNPTGGNARLSRAGAGSRAA